MAVIITSEEASFGDKTNLLSLYISGDGNPLLNSKSSAVFLYFEMSSCKPIFEKDVLHEFAKELLKSSIPCTLLLLQ